MSWTVYEGKSALSLGEGNALVALVAGGGKAVLGCLARVSAGGCAKGAKALMAGSSPVPHLFLALRLPVIAARAAVLVRPAGAGTARAAAGVALAPDAPAKAGMPGALAWVTSRVVGWGGGTGGCGVAVGESPGGCGFLGGSTVTTAAC